MAGMGLPSLLLEEGSKVLLGRFVRDKSEPPSDAVELLMANSRFAPLSGRMVKKPLCLLRIWLLILKYPLVLIEQIMAMARAI